MTAATTVAVASPRRPVAPASRASSTTATNTATAGIKFAVQIAALNDPLRAKATVQQLRDSGMPAYMMNPAPDDPDGPYRVRVGPYDSRDDAEKVAASLEQQRHQKLWVTKER
ncbi:MAG: SPOR domain-containing protein [Acidobacteria bacterium]|nr:SPOR domain-containing protein [Acidobacteriota bacterium]